MSDSGDQPIRHSIFERIAFTYDLDPTDRCVLVALATFGTWRTGRNNRPRLDTLAAKCRMQRRALLRSLERLTKAKYLIAHRSYKKPTSYDICFNRLAKDMDGTSLGVKNDTQDDEFEDCLGVKNDTQEGDKSVTNDTQEGVLGVKNDILWVSEMAPNLPVRTDHQYVRSPIKDDPPIRTPALRAEAPNTKPKTTTADDHQTTARRIAKVLRGLVARPHWWTDYGDVKEALRRELRRLEIVYTPADLDDAVSWIDAALLTREKAATGRRRQYA